MSKLRLGMSQEQVIETLGDPTTVQANGEKREVYLVYKRMRHAISAWPRLYRVTLKDGKVISWGEHHHEQIIQHY